MVQSDALFTIGAILEAHKSGTPLTETIERVYARIEAYGDPALFISLRPKAEVLETAKILQDQGFEGKPLYGIPFAVKDNIDVAGLPTTCACPEFAYIPARSAFVVEQLEQAGAIVIGKTNLDQFATGLVGVRSPYGVPRNCLNPDLVPGGSSSGSAVVVGAGIVPFSLGTDTAGSGRVPAALNGIVGLKPSLGTLSATGVVPACRTLDTISVFALNVEDAFLVYRTAAIFDSADSYARKFNAPQMGKMPAHLRVGVPRPDQLKFFGDGLAQKAFEDDIRSLNATIIECDMEPFYAVARLLYEGPWVAERYAATKSLLERNPAAFHPVTRTIIEAARKFDAVSYFEAAYKLSALKRETQALWSSIDIMAVPTIPRPYTIADLAEKPVEHNSSLGTYTNFVNLLDLAAIAVPSGMRADGLPSSLTLIGQAGTDGLLASVALPIQLQSHTNMGATGIPCSSRPPAIERTVSTRIEIAVIGAHLSGMPLNHEITSSGGVFVRTVQTAPAYKLFALPGTVPAKPGLLQVGEGGASIQTEIWSLDPAAFGRFVANIPAPLGIGTLTFDDGTTAKGFLVEALAVKAAKDVSSFGGWRAYMGSLT